MALAQSTSAKLGNWFADYIESGQAESAAAPTTTTIAPTAGLLSTSTSPPAPAASAPEPNPSPGANPVERPAAVNITGISTTSTPAPTAAAPTTAPSVAPAPAPTPAPVTPPAAPATATASAQTTPGGLIQSAPAPAGTVTTLNLDELSRRHIDPATETVEGRLEGLLDDNGAYIQGARSRTMRTANARGLMNSSIAASAGEEAATKAAFDIANADAAAFQKAGDYNVAVENQGRMYNADTYNKMSLEQLQAANQQAIAAQQTAASTANAAASAAASRYNAELSAAGQRYATDEQGRRQAEQLAQERYNSEQNRISTETRQANEIRASQVNNIMMNNEIPPEVRARLLRELGEPGLAAAIYIANEE